MNLRVVLVTLGMLVVLAAPALAQDTSDLKAGDPETRLLMEQGSRFYLQHDFKRAIPPYQRPSIGKGKPHFGRKPLARTDR
jgi:hypothetical protein